MSKEVSGIRASNSRGIHIQVVLVRHTTQTWGFTKVLDRCFHVFHMTELSGQSDVLTLWTRGGTV